MYEVTFTYDVVSPESASKGDTYDNGFAYHNGVNLEKDFSIKNRTDVKNWKVQEYRFSTYSEAEDFIYSVLGSDVEWGNETDVYQLDPWLNMDNGHETRFAAHINEH